MKKTVTIILAIALVLSVVISCVACGDKTGGKDVPGFDKENHVITVGNTAATTGAFAGVGVPFNYAQEAYFWYYTTQTDGYVDADGNKYTIDFKHYDDGFDGTKGMTYTQKLVEDDKIFALVGHFGTNTVGATMDYIEDYGIPMVYGVTGASDLYNTERNVMTVQPIYDTEGQSMVATAFAPESVGGLAATKVGVISTTDEAGKGMLNGIQIEVAKLGKGSSVVYQAVAADATDFTAPVTALKTAGCDVVIVAANQAPFIKIANTFVTAAYDNVDILTSYVSANATAMGGLVATGAITATREVYAGAWLLTGSVPSETKGWADFMEYCKIITAYDKAHGNTLLTTYPIETKDKDGNVISSYDLFDVYFATFNTETLAFDRFDWAKDGISAYFLNSYAMAGYVSANVFCQGLTRMSGKDLTWEGFIDAMEDGPINVPMGLQVDYSNGNRIGIDALAVNKYTVANKGVGDVYREITVLKTLEDAING
ncbi:MAG: ABC transporter substrate-binding protein [Clostridia bacterium]|nr:ABC transporter substrate-binding protein [Clostridia bacterium]